jgi:putative nucleotidyltransferase with HDIG domain
LPLFIPELAACRGVAQQDYRGFHCFDVADHLFYACDGAPKENPVVRLAALFHDVGKPRARQVLKKSDPQGRSQEAVTFYNHDKISASLCRQILLRLKFPNHTVDAVCHLVGEHMFFYEASWTDAAVRRFIRRVTPEALPDLLDLRRADSYGMTGSPPSLNSGPWVQSLLELQGRVAAVLAEKSALDLNALAVSGKDLIAAGIPPGKIMGEILRELMETVLDDPGENEKEHLLHIAQNLYTKHTHNSTDYAKNGGHP